jgi:uncharacterized protein YqhQ
LFFLLAILFVMFVFPWLFLPIVLFFLLNLFLLPFKFTMQSLLTLITIPGQIWQIATNRRLRSNHALEHATINVIEERYGQQQLAGIANEDGFFIKGSVQPQLLEEAARIGLRRLQQGEKQLAIHKRCGTSMAAANFLSSAMFIFLLAATKQFTLLNVLLAILTANILGPLLGEQLQRYFTTQPDVNNMGIIGIEYRTPDYGMFPFSFIPTEFFIRTYYPSHS